MEAGAVRSVAVRFIAGKYRERAHLHSLLGDAQPLFFQRKTMAKAAGEPHDLQAAIWKIWRKNKELTEGRLKTLESAAASLRNSSLTPEHRVQAAAEAHQLAGSLAAFGLSEEAQLCRSLEKLLKGKSVLTRQNAGQMSQLLRPLRAALKMAAQKLKANG